MLEMAKMPEELVDLIRQWHTIPMATTGEDGRPNVAPKSCMVLDKETLIFTELFFRQTFTNLKKNPVASVCVWQRQPPYDAFKINGRIELVEEGPLIEELERRMLESHSEVFIPRTGNMVAYVLHVEEIYDQTPSPAGGGERIA